MAETEPCTVCCGICWGVKDAHPEETITTYDPLIDQVNATYLGDLPQPLLTGHYVTVVGRLKWNCSRFSINFACGNEKNSDIAFHFNPRLDQNYVVRNSNINGKWGKEETASLYRLNISRQNSFTIGIFVAPTEFMVSVNHAHFCNFSFRMPNTKVTHLIVFGEVEIGTVVTDGSSTYPVNVNIPVVPTAEPKTDKPLPNPFIGHLEHAFRESWQLEIVGKVKLLPQSFCINLQEGSQLWPHPNIPLHLNPRFYDGDHKVIRNAWQNGNWGFEERAQANQFLPGHQFHLIIRRESDHFSVWADGKLTGIFTYRNPVKKIDTVFIQGDLVLRKVWLSDDVKSILIASSNAL